MKKIILYPIMVLLIASLALAVEVTRTFQKTEVDIDEELKVTFTPPDGTRVWTVEIPTPNGWDIEGYDFPPSRNFKIIALNDDSSKTYTFIPSIEGDFDFTGTYTVDDSGLINYQTETIKVGAGGGCTPSWTYGNWGECTNNKQFRTGNDGCGNSVTEERTCEVEEDVCEWYQTENDVGECEFNKLYIVIGVIIGLFIIFK